MSNNTTIKAIETVYKGYRMRSRLEARYGVLFDHLGIQWEYEAEGYELPSGNYLPDFWLPQHKMFVEIKGKEPADNERQLAHELSCATSFPVMISSGTPGFKPAGYWDGYEPEHIAEVFAGSFGNRIAFDWRRVSFQPGCMANFDAVWRDMLHRFLLGSSEPKGVMRGRVETLPADPSELERRLIELDCLYYKEKHGRDHPSYQFGYHWKRMTFGADQGSKKLAIVPADMVYIVDDVTEDAIIAARAARFEHGESPA